MRTLNDVIGKLPPARQQKVETRARELIAEELTLQDIRKAQKLTQEQMATVLNIGQDSISRLEKRSDMMLSTMRSYIETGTSPHLGKPGIGGAAGSDET